MELTAVLEDSGFQVLGPAASVPEALGLLKHQQPHAAVLDMNLGGEPAVPVARMLRRMEVPFTVASAYARSSWPNDDVLDGVVSLGKPTAPRELVRTLRELISDGTTT